MGKLPDAILALVSRAARDVDIEQIRKDVAAFVARRPDLTRRQQADRLVKRTAWRAAALGAAASLPPGFAAAATIGPELSTLIWLQSRMILGLHLLHGVPPDPEERTDEVLLGLAAGAGVRMGRSLGKLAAEEVARRLAARALGRGGSHLVPVAGVAAGALLNYAAVMAVGRAVRARLEKRVVPGEEAPEPEPPVVEARGRVS